VRSCRGRIPRRGCDDDTGDCRHLDVARRFVTAPGADSEHGLGRGGEPIHAWATTSTDEIDRDLLRRQVEATGSIVMGRRTFDFVDGPHGWSDEIGYGADHAATPPAFVVTRHAPASVRLGGRFSFVTDGIAAAIERATRAAGDKDVVVMGGAEIVRQTVAMGLADRLRVHIAPVLLGAGKPLFQGSAWQQLVQESVVVSSFATHITYVFDRSA
jgi:dihydrofolate reductase